MRIDGRKSFKEHGLYVGLQDSWKNFVKGQVIIGEVRQIIVDSWHRSVKNRISPYQKRVNNVLSEKDIFNNESKNKDLMDVSLPVMENLYKFVAGSGFTVTLIDNKGIILKIIGDQVVVDSVAKGNFIIGADWSEESAGTNAIGLALKLNQPIQVFSYEHFCICSHNSTCSAAPIHDPEGNIIGVLDMTGDFEKVHSHTLGMVVAAVHGIEKQLESKYAWGKFNVANSYLNSIVESVSAGMVAINEHRIITHVNNYAINMLEADRDEIIGRDVGTYFKASFMIEEKKELLGFTDKEVDIISNGKVKKAIISSRKIEGLPSGMQGAVLVFNELNRTRKLVQRMSGLEAKLTFEDIIGENEMFLKTVKLAKNAARSQSNVLLLGESGTGKDVFAQAIHNWSQCSKGPFVAINCGAIPRELISSELFGYEEGAFTGARRGGNPGKFEMADGGTLFLDEIGEMPLELQTVLLRVIETKSIMRIGGKDLIPVNVRIIAATNKNLLKEVDQGNFRRDLYYRLNVISINLLPLRDRKDDIPLLCEHFLKKINYQLGKEVNEIEQAVHGCFNYYDWPGNVRELYNVLERSMNIAQCSKLLVSALPYEFTAIQKTKKPIVHQSFDELEMELISNLMTDYSGNLTKIANKLGIARTTLYRKLDKYDLR